MKYASGLQPTPSLYRVVAEKGRWIIRHRDGRKFGDFGDKEAAELMADKYNTSAKGTWIDGKFIGTD